MSEDDEPSNDMLLKQASNLKKKPKKKKKAKVRGVVTDSCCDLRLGCALVYLIICCSHADHFVAKFNYCKVYFMPFEGLFWLSR